MKNRNLLFVLTAFGLLMTGCGDGTQQKSKEDKENIMDESAEGLDIPEDGESVRNTTIVFPSAPEIMTVFKNAGLKYQPGLMNPTSKRSKYETQFQKALATGIYTADLAYAVTHGQNQEASEYLKAVVELSDELGISGVAGNDSLLNAFDESLGDEEATLDVISEIQSETDRYIEENEMQDLATLIFSGAWLEGMYIGVKANDNFSKQDLSDRISEQIHILENKLNALESTDLSGSEYENYIADLKSIEDMYNSFDEVKNAEGAVNLSLQNLKKVANEIKNIREKFVK